MKTERMIPVICGIGILAAAMYLAPPRQSREFRTWFRPSWRVETPEPAGFSAVFALAGPRRTLASAPCNGSEGD